MPGGGADGQVQFAGQVTMTGPPADIEAARATLKISPGEVITVPITATPVESNPSETNYNGSGLVDDEISGPKLKTTVNFVIPVAQRSTNPYDRHFEWYGRLSVPAQRGRSEFGR